MTIQSTPIEGCFILQPSLFTDERGTFQETFHSQRFKEATGLDVDFVQDNQSTSSRGVLRGLHFQAGEMAQAKLVRVVEGAVLDVVVDLRKGSPSFGQSFSLELTADNRLQLFVPRGFAHGFLTLSERSVFAYKCDNYYDRESESGIRYDDPTLRIDWGMAEEELIVSAKDKMLPAFQELFG
jgi:dTDP-4-dehydrorhamnose 3,5-epimerase